MAAPTAEALASKLKLEDLEPGGQRLLVRVDLNVPVQDGAVADDTRIRATLPTVRWLLDAGAAVILMSHRGRPKGRPDPELGMRPVAAALEEALGATLDLFPDCVGEEVERRAAGLQPGRVALLENLRFHAGEKANEADFAAALAALGDAYVDDAFGAAHRAHASIVGVAERMETAAAGRLMVREVDMLSRVLERPQGPFVLLLGGAKVSDKLEALDNLLPLADRMVVGGAMANAFLAATGRDIGASRIEAGAAESASRLLSAAEEQGVDVVLPEDFVVAPSIEEPDRAHRVDEVPADAMILDIGPESRQRFADAIAGARTVVWNGPMGVFEVDAFAAGTFAVAEAVAGLGESALTVLGGGDTAAAAAAAGIQERVSHVSTGGGAALDLLSGALLPGVEALTDRHDWLARRHPQE